MLTGEITESEKQKAKEKDPGLQAFIKCKDLETLSYPIVQELIETIYFYAPEHIEVIWKYRDEYVRNACAV